MPFFLVVDFELNEPRLFTLDQLANHHIEVQFPNFCTTNVETQSTGSNSDFVLSKHPQSYDQYVSSYKKIQHHLHYGNSFLTNLTASTPITLDMNLSQIYNQAQAPYKIKFAEDWVCFSPESFVQIQHGMISSYPMKGTIDASLPNAKQLILNDPKETAEHYTIVDLIRNDLALVASDIEVKRFRYIDLIETNTKSLYQVSSEIMGKLPEDYLVQLGDILFALLPAGSISGAPKKKTVEIIQEAEYHQRGFYTGVAFYFDGETLDSCVLIRFVEQTPQGLVYKSGGGITINSKAEEEYQELLDKIYVPGI